VDHGLIDLLKVRARATDDIVRQAPPYFTGAIVYDSDAVSKGWKDRPASAETLRAVRETLANVTEWSPAALEESLRQLAEARGTSAGKLFQPMRVALTGLTASPGMFEMLMMMGRQLTLRRLDDGVSWLTSHATTG
jgi:glutamyl/glutaminyl-tRNA synthetase